MKEPEEVKMAQPQSMTVEQAAEFHNIRNVQDLISAFPANAKGVKALKQLYKTMLDGFKKYLQAKNGDHFLAWLWFFTKAKTSCHV